MLFKFDNQDVRVVKRLNGTYFVASDVCKILDLPNVGMALSRLDGADISTADVSSEGPLRPGQRRSQTVKVVNESGLYDLVLESRKPEAKRFRRWITSEVLPKIRETGSYDIDDVENQTDLALEAQGFMDKVADVQHKAGERDGIHSYHKGWTRSDMGKMAKKELKFPGNLRDFNLVLMALGVTVVAGAKCNQWALAPEYYWMADDALVYKRSLGSRVPNTNPHFNAEGKARLFKMVQDFVDERGGVLIK